MNQSNSNKQVLLSVIGIAILVVAVVGVSFAFFNYTRTGEANTVRTGTIYFNSSNTLISVDNLFPVSKTDSRITNANTTSAQVSDVVGVAVVTVEGYTTYAGGVDYIVTAEDVNFNTSVPNPAHETDTSAPENILVPLPISVRVSTTGLGSVTANNITTATDAAARIDRTQLGGTNTNKVATYSYELPAGTITNTERAAFVTLADHYLLAKGHIATGTDLGSNYSGTTGYTAAAAGTITIKAYIDKDMVAITDTVQNGDITVEHYENGTTSTWIGGRTVFTTAQWNSLNATNASFRIKVEAGETHIDANGTNPDDGDATAIIGAY